MVALALLDLTRRQQWGSHDQARVRRFNRLKTNYLESVFRLCQHMIDMMHVVQAMNSRQRAIDDASQFGSVLRVAVFKQTLLRLFRPEPAGISIRLLRRVKPGYFAEIRGNRYCRSMAQVSGKWNSLDAPVRASLFHGLKGCGLGVG
jgi:hypothetical protein